MPRPTGFEPVLSAKATAFLFSLPKARQRKLIDLIFRLARFPTQSGDYAANDELGREIQFLLVGELVLGFWADHAAKELRITEIDEV